MEDTNVVAVARVHDNGSAECSGSLLAPNLVLTAHHCVADVENEVNGLIDCQQSSFDAPDVAGNFLVTTRASLSSDAADYRGVVDVLIPPSSTGTRFCGLDVALLILDDIVPPSEAAPLTPGIGEPIDDGDSYAAVGFGTTGSGGDAGTRHRRDGLDVMCATGTCGADGALDLRREWVGGGGPCQGDSGGPALNLAGDVIGVLSRANEDCDRSIYGDVFVWSDFLVESAQTAADFGDYEPPTWAGGSPSSSGGCSSAGTGSAWLLALLLLFGKPVSRRSRRG